MRQTLSAVVEAVRHTITTTPRQQADQHYWLRHQSAIQAISPSVFFFMETSSPVFGNFAILVHDVIKLTNKNILANFVVTN